MAYVVLGPDDLQYSSEVAGAVVSPANPEGQSYQYFLVRPGGYDAVFADTLDDVLDAIIPGYGTLEDPTDQAEARILLAESAAAVLQAQILATMNPDDLSDEEWRVLNAPRLGPQAPTPERWASSIPLFVVETAYTPYTELPRPSSATDGIKSDNLVWIRPTEPEDFVMSLHEAGFIRLMENTD